MICFRLIQMIPTVLKQLEGVICRSASVLKKLACSTLERVRLGDNSPVAIPGACAGRASQKLSHGQPETCLLAYKANNNLRISRKRAVACFRIRRGNLLPTMM